LKNRLLNLEDLTIATIFHLVCLKKWQHLVLMAEGFKKLFLNHPPLEERIAALRAR